LHQHGYTTTKSFTEIGEGLAYARVTKPSLVIIDMMMPFVKIPNGVRKEQNQPYILYDAQMSFSAVHEMKLKCPGTRVLMLTGERHPHMFLRGFECGADGIASKVDDLKTCLAILDQVMAGMSRVASDRIATILRSYMDSQIPGLTQLEVHILELVQEGLESPQIGKRLHYSAKTVRNSLSIINQKLGTSTRFEAVETATEMGLVGWRTGYESRI
jgi:DNA-binding NarL/FixJ family response regulator